MFFRCSDSAFSQSVGSTAGVSSKASDTSEIMEQFLLGEQALDWGDAFPHHYRRTSVDPPCSLTGVFPIMLALSLWPLFAAAPVLPLPADKNSLLLYGGIGAGGMLLLLILIALLRRDRSKINPERGLAEDLSKIPAAAKGPRHYQLLAMSQPVRLRLVV